MRWRSRRRPPSQAVLRHPPAEGSCANRLLQLLVDPTQRAAGQLHTDIAHVAERGRGDVEAHVLETALRVFKLAVAMEGELTLADTSAELDEHTVAWLNHDSAPRWEKYARASGHPATRTTAECYGTSWLVDSVRHAVDEA